MGRYTIDMGPEFVKLLKEIQTIKGITKGEVIRRAVASYDYLIRNSNEKGGTKVSITNGKDEVLKDIILP